jgi:indole-3-glycerol phosphate synthase/phosphoribosylanthranilate isomerase
MGIQSVSVLTEEEYFSGSLQDLLNVKTACPDLAVLRKDFIISEEDVEISFRAGADAILLIASLLDRRTLMSMYKKAKSLGLEVLFEVHDEKDLVKAAHVQPTCTGFNSRDLNTFKIDLTVPIRLSAKTSWKTRKVFESGITSVEEADLALSCGFEGLLIGEAVMKNRSLIGGIKKSFITKKGNFWLLAFSKKKENRPLVKICGITTQKDAEMALDMGADILGFVFADSPRRASFSLLSRIEKLDVLKAGVVVLEKNQHSLPKKIKDLMGNGLLDVVQFHGNESPVRCRTLAFPYYKAVRVKDNRDIEKIGLYRCPRVLFDTYVAHVPGGSGTTIPGTLVERIKERYPLWLAGGIGPYNVKDVLMKYRPELIDASSRLEMSPGRKDPGKMKTFFKEIDIGPVL